MSSRGSLLLKRLLLHVMTLYKESNYQSKVVIINPIGKESDKGVDLL